MNLIDYGLVLFWYHAEQRREGKYYPMKINNDVLAINKHMSDSIFIDGFYNGDHFLKGLYIIRDEEINFFALHKISVLYIPLDQLTGQNVVQTFLKIYAPADPSANPKFLLGYNKINSLMQK